ncbi:hypothetical protein RhiirC2_735679 [Rhizophagus irregularis]|uniref:Fork-head domain-containing protein n=1 Tax=Rhizophagus irregularis TaxID=588596 RepID=A0A2N1NPP0_9GLOM|nr:hypothetical protein RhiirC2_735679 [Rhizophagus irregularis]
MGNDENLAPKPDYSYASMICQAIFSSSGKKSTLAEIYEWICSTYPFFKRNQQGWKPLLEPHVAKESQEREVTGWSIPNTNAIL